MDLVVLAQEEAIGAGFLAFFALFYLAFIVLFIAAAWKLFTKAGEDGWKVLVPFYNIYVFLQIVGRPGWWLLLYFVPLVGFVISIIVAIDTAKSFGKDTAFAVGLIFLSPIFYPILAFGDARYLGPAGPEPRPGYANVGQGGYGAQGYYGAPQGGYQPPPGQNWGQQPQGLPQGQPQWGQQPDAQQWGQQPSPPPGQPQWDQPPPGQPQGGQQPPGSQWGQPPADQGWGQPPARPGSEDYPPPPV
ncbi:MAG TPA: DUF5684 domain-containing protein [Euzebya sp.]|nr:DUF5684 domain-containing protein [Euzebya sp.]